MLVATLDASLLGNMLAGKVVITDDDGVIWADEGKDFAIRKKISFCACLISRFGDCKKFHGYLISRFQ